MNVSQLKIILIFLAYQISHNSFAHSLNEKKEKVSQPAISENKKVTAMKNHEIIDRYKNSELDDIPPTVPVTAEQQEYIAYLYKSMLDVIKQKKNLSENDPIFGKGEFFWPKDPSKPIKASISYDVENFKFGSISVGFGRKNSSSPWNSAGISIQPRNFPYGFFDMKFTKAFFDDLVLEKATTEERKNEAVKIVNVFLYKTKENDRGIKLRFDASPTVSDVKDKYPRSFHYLYIDTD